MAQSPVIPAVMPNLEFLEHYIDCLENLPLDVQRYISQIREYDLLYKNKLSSLGQYLCLYQQEPPGPTKRSYLNKVQKCLIKSQHYGDVKLNLISQIMELVDNRSELLLKDTDTVHPEKKEEENKNLNNTNMSNHLKEKLKIEKPNKVVPKESSASKSIYDKPKRIRRVRATEKSGEKNDRSSSRASNKQEKDEEDELMEEEEEPETKSKKDTKKSSKDRDVKLKEKEKDRPSKEDKEEKEEKKIERKDKNTSGKVIKKPTNKIQSKIKKQKKKKEKEVVTEDVPIDPDEPTYCICNRISFGDMIGCDNDSCVFEWFHFECVNLAQKPKGKWYCPQCTTERKEKNKK